MLCVCLFVFHQNRKKGQVFKYGTRGVLSGLTANAIYKIWMTASTVDKEGERSDVITVKTCKGLDTRETYSAFCETKQTY